MSAVLHPHALVRPMTLADLPTIAAIDAQCYPFPWTPGNFADSLHAGYYCCVYQIDGDIIGYAVVLLAAGEAHLLNITIAPWWQGLGLGRILLQKVVARAQQDQAQTMWLEVRPSNVIAQQLYGSQGFVDVAIRKNYYPAQNGRENALVMCLDLSYAK
ncbi:MAG: ribosomal protein S18-alanine N-acetyltransferase [Sulfuriferula sp.]